MDFYHEGTEIAESYLLLRDLSAFVMKYLPNVKPPRASHSPEPPAKRAPLQAGGHGAARITSVFAKSSPLYNSGRPRACAKA